MIKIARDKIKFQSNELASERVTSLACKKKRPNVPLSVMLSYGIMKWLVKYCEIITAAPRTTMVRRSNFYLHLFLTELFLFARALETESDKKKT